MKLERSNEVSAWQEIRADYVNGNITSAKEKFYQQSKVKMLRTVWQALRDYRDALNESGDITDLRELIQIMIAGKK